MKKNNNIIVINGRHYDAVTGELLAGAAPQPAQAVSVSRPTQPAAVLSVAQPAVEPAAHRPVKHTAAHQPKPPQTLMRQAVKKPVSDSSRRIKAQGRLDGSAQRTASKLLTKSTARQPDTRRLQNPATKRPKGQLISHFSPSLFAVDRHTPAATYGMAPVKSTIVHAPGQPAPAERPRSTAELLEYAVQRADAPGPQQPHHHRRRKILKRRAHHV